jgi:hypothetical protein
LLFYSSAALAGIGEDSMTLKGADFSAGAEHWSLAKYNTVYQDAATRKLFFMRYLGTGWGSGKGFTLTEWQVSQKWKVPVGWFLEYGEKTELGGAPVGTIHAKRTKAEFNKLGIPITQPAFYACDTGLTVSQFVTIREFFKAIVAEVGVDAVGCYGQGNLIKYLFDNKLIKYGCQATAFGTGIETRAQLRQYSATVNVGGVTCDQEEAFATDWGQYPRPGIVVPVPTPTPPPVVSPYPNKVNLSVTNPHMHDGVNGITGIKKVQTRLIQLGFSCGPNGADGEYGANTANAVSAFKKGKPNLTVPGVVGPETWNALFKA